MDAFHYGTPENPQNGCIPEVCPLCFSRRSPLGRWVCQYDLTTSAWADWCRWTWKPYHGAPFEGRNSHDFLLFKVFR